VHVAGALSQEDLWGATRDTAPLPPRKNLPILYADYVDDSLMGLVSPEHTLSFARDNGEVWTADSQPSQSPLPSPASGSPLTHPAAVSPAVTDADQTSPLTPLPAGFLGETNDRYDHLVYPILVSLRDGVAGQRRLRCRSDILRLVSQAIDSPMEMWGDIIDALIVVLFPAEERVKAKRRAGAPLSRAGPTEGLNRSQRKAAAYKKMQDLYSRHPRLLADLIASGSSIEDDPSFPGLGEIMTVHGSNFESDSPPDTEDPVRVPMTSPARHLRGYLAVSAEELGSAKTRWPRSAPGLNGITVEKVIKAPDVALLILFNMVLASAYHPVEWRTMRTVMVPKAGNRRDPHNWRPITVVFSLQRLLHRIVYRRMDGLVP
jgi:hypothetical protein